MLKLYALLLNQGTAVKASITSLHLINWQCKKEIPKEITENILENVIELKVPLVVDTEYGINLYEAK